MKYNYCIGNFDGVHIGHQALIEECLRLQKENGCPAAAITFEPSVVSYFSKNEIKCLSTMEQKKELFHQYGIDEIVFLPFDEVISRMSAHDFIRFILNSLDIQTLVIGKDFSFGYKAEGNMEYLMNSDVRNFDVVCIDHVMIDDKKVASSDIRNLVSDGKISDANRLLGHNYSISTYDNVLPPAGKYLVELNGQQREYKFNPEAKIRNITFISEL